MRHITFVVALLACVASETLMLRPQGGQQSPKEVVEEFCKFETSGGRLTPEGWKSAERSFVRTLPLPKSKIILVTAKDYSVWDPIFRTEDRADVMVAVSTIWKIDSRMSLKQYSSPNESKSGFVYTVIRDKNSESGDGREVQKAHGPSEWKIEGVGENIWLTADTAIRYVTEVRDHTSDPVIKQNAEKTLIKLKQMLKRGG
jgi:hypothetical protein